MDKKQPQVVFKRDSLTTPLPSYQHPGDSGMDVCAWEEGSLGPGEFRAVSTGLRCAIEPGYEIQVRPRSGLAFKHGVTVLNSPGTIDSGYRGEIKVILINHHPTETFHYKPGDRIAQLVVARVHQAAISFVVPGVDLPDSSRGEGGFGSTGIKSGGGAA